jgi:hypothetical protein
MENEEIDVSIESFLDTIDKTVNNELKFVKSKDWSNVDIPKDRNDMHDLQFLLTDRNVNHATKLYNLAIQKNADNDKRVKTMLKTLISFYEIYERRYDHYTGKQDFNKILDGIETSKVNIKAEIEFQSDLAKNLTKFKESVRKIQLDGDKSRNQIQVYNDTPIPLLMRKSVENRYPIVKEIYETKLNAK